MQRRRLETSNSAEKFPKTFWSEGKEIEKKIETRPDGSDTERRRRERAAAGTFKLSVAAVVVVYHLSSLDQGPQTVFSCLPFLFFPPPHGPDTLEFMGGVRDSETGEQQRGTTDKLQAQCRHSPRLFIQHRASENTKSDIQHSLIHFFQLFVALVYKLLQ